MEAETSTGPVGGRRRRRLITDVKDSLRGVNNQLALLNHRVGARAGLKIADLDCLDVIARDGPLSLSALARRAGLHPATITGIVDRLEAAGWVVREPHPVDRRTTVVNARRERAGDLVRLYAGMNTAVDHICGRYSDAELELLADFLRRTADAGRTVMDELAED